MGGPNIIENIKRFDRAFTSLVRGDDIHIEKSIRRENMAWSLEDFNKLCSGKYNAGSLKINRAGNLDIVNNHAEGLEILNGKSISATDSFAIRRAFAGALEENGLSKAQMNEVRARLGLRRDNNTISSGLCFTPLRRQEVREIMDKYINVLNENRTPEHRFQTQEEMQVEMGFSDLDVKAAKNTRDTINEANKQNVKIPFDSDMLHALDLLSSDDFSDRSIFTDDALHDTALFFEDFEDQVQELAHLTEEDLQIWRHENPGKTFYIPVGGGNCYISIDPKTKKMLFSAKGKDAESKLVTFSTGLKPTTVLKRIRAANERLHAEGAKRGLNLAGKEFVDGNVGKEISKPKDIIIEDKINPSIFSSLPDIIEDKIDTSSPNPKQNIIDEPVGGKEFIKTKDVNTKIKREGKYNIIEERDDKPKKVEKKFSDPLIPVDTGSEDEGSDIDDNPIIPIINHKK